MKSGVYILRDPINGLVRYVKSCGERVSTAPTHQWGASVEAYQCTGPTKPLLNLDQHPEPPHQLK